MLQDGGRKYLGGIEELIRFAESMVAPPFDRSEDDASDWVAIAQQKCEVSKHVPLRFLRGTNIGYIDYMYLCVVLDSTSGHMRGKSTIDTCLQQYYVAVRRDTTRRRGKH